jgi:anaerobic selenocysteine-containing dehydrogenase
LRVVSSYRDPSDRLRCSPPDNSDRNGWWTRCSGSAPTGCHWLGRQFPHGLDLGALEPGRFRDRIATPDRYADAAPEDLLREARSHLPVEADRKPTDGLLLIGRRQLRDNNSWMHNSARLVKGPRRCTLLVHPEDAAARQLADGDLARFGSEIGSIVVPVQVSETMRPGVVSLPHGWGHDRSGVRMRVARAYAGGSINDVTSERHLDTLSGTVAFTACR